MTDNKHENNHENKSFLSEVEYENGNVTIRWGGIEAVFLNIDSKSSFYLDKSGLGLLLTCPGNPALLLYDHETRRMELAILLYKLAALARTVKFSVCDKREKTHACI